MVPSTGRSSRRLSLQLCLPFEFSFLLVFTSHHLAFAEVPTTLAATCRFHLTSLTADLARTIYSRFSSTPTRCFFSEISFASYLAVNPPPRRFDMSC
ncbi:hypothetical protein HPP92_005543 [Vanilla planifolia]|uniref:Secreted protein n=1 Tax=Vanilla planifolia TaxID=51239 RepID=A0A835RSB9_VANPL|nr:hypothetical protein HPP92_005543 [Vanilla planifolia]